MGSMHLLVLAATMLAVCYAAQTEGHNSNPTLQGGIPSQQQLSMKQVISEHLLSTDSPCTHLLMHLYGCAQDSAQWSSGVQHDNSTAVSMCWAPPSDSSIHREGLLAIRETTLSSKAGDQHSTYRVRAVGRQVKQIHVQYCGRGLHLGHVSLWGDGAYHFEVLRLYQNFSFLDVKSHQLVTRISTFTWNLTDAAATTSPAGLPNIPCIRLPVHGAWITTQPDHAHIQGLHTTYTHYNFPGPSPMTLSFNQSVLQWRPLSCRLLTWSDIARLGCLNDRHVCFVGDSHVRNLHNGYVVAVPRILAHDPDPTAGSQDRGYSRGKVVFPSSIATFFWDPFGNVTQLRALDRCTDVVLSMGQWPLSSKAGQAPWTLEQFQRVVTGRAALLAAAQAQGKGALWVGMPAFPWNASTLGPSPRDWRTLPWIQLFSTVATRVMAQHSVTTADVFDMTATLIDTTVDGCHFPPNGTVGHALNQYLLHLLCSVRRTRKVQVASSGLQGSTMLM